MMKRIPLGLIVVGVVGFGASAAKADDQSRGGSLQGWVELLYRSVDVDGSSDKYNEDFDGLGDGMRVRNLGLIYDRSDGRLMDFARLDMRGLGGDPWESIDFRLGNAGFYEVSANWTKQSYIYNLFDGAPDRDAHVYDTERQITNIALTFFPTEKIEVRAAYRENQRTGDTLFMKNEAGDDFALPTPMDLVYRYYTVGATFEAGPVDIVFEQTLRDHTIHFNHVAGVLGEGQVGLGAGTVLNEYDWNQQQTGTEDVTTLIVSSEIGQRVDITAAIFGTLLGSQTVQDTVLLNSDSVTDGTNLTKLEADWFVGDLGLSVLLHRIATFHLNYRSYTYDVKGDNLDDLGGTGAPAGSNTKFDWERKVVSALFEVRPLRTLTLRLGGRQAERMLVRNGFGRPNRDTDFRSDPDRSLTGGLTWRATGWFTLNANYEDVQVDQPFTAPSISDSQRVKARLIFTPKDGAMRAVVGYIDKRNDNTSANFRSPTDQGDPACDPGDPSQAAGTCRWNSNADVTRWDLSWFHKPNPRVDYLLRYAEEGIRTATEVAITASIPGLDIYDVDTTHGLAQVNFSWADPWNAYFRLWIADSDGATPLIAAGFTDTPSARIMQEYRDGDVGVRYTFPNGVFLGGSVRRFDYDDANDLLDYDGSILTFSGGLAF
jgi:hypothetical protein